MVRYHAIQSYELHYTMIYVGREDMVIVSMQGQIVRYSSDRKIQ